MIYNAINPDKRKDIDNLIKKYDKNVNEFETSLFSNKELSDNLLTFEKFNNLNSVLSIVTKDKDVKSEQSLDISLIEQFEDKVVNYRISIFDNEQINEYMNMLHQRRNHLVYSIIVRFIYDKNNANKTDSMKLIKKTKYFNS